jgi:hypothetical protein
MNGYEPTGEGHHGTAHRRPVVAIRLGSALAVGVAGALAGHSAGYWIGRRWGPRLLSSPLGRRVGPVRLHKVGGGPCPAQLRRRCWLASGPPPHRASRPPARPGAVLVALAVAWLVHRPARGTRTSQSSRSRQGGAPTRPARQVDFAQWLQVRSGSEGRLAGHHREPPGARRRSRRRWPSHSRRVAAHRELTYDRVRDQEKPISARLGSGPGRPTSVCQGRGQSLVGLVRGTSQPPDRHGDFDCRCPATPPSLVTRPELTWLLGVRLGADRQLSARGRRRRRSPPRTVEPCSAPT